MKMQQILSLESPAPAGTDDTAFRATRRHLTAGAFAAPLAALLAACALRDGTEETVPGPSKTPVTLRYTHAWSPLYLDRMDRIIADFNAKHPNVKAEHQRLPAGPGKLHEDLMVVLAAGSPPDVTMQWRGAMPAFAAKGSLVALDPFIRRDKFDTSIYYENELRSSQFLGKTYLLPAAASGAWYLLFYNRDHFREAGLDENKPPATWDEATRYTGLLTRRSADNKIERLGFEPALRDAGTFNSPFAAWLHTNDGKFASDDGRKLLFESPQGTATLDWMLAVVKQLGGREAFDDFVSRAKGGHDSFPIGLRSIYMTNHSFPARLKEVAKDLRYGIGTLPRGSANGAKGIVRGGWANGIPTGVKAPHESWLLTQYLSATKEGAGWFMQEQVRPSPIRAVNESPVYRDLPHWDMIKAGLVSDIIVAQTPMDLEIDTLTAKAVTEVYQGKTLPKEALQFAQREGQRLLDEFWVGVKR
ncbi:MAG: extracellular solute-binding protein [Chloroflexi bacterium]|nr:extracellular solute-binding protein [Chloroflexota bacterium]